MQLLPRVLRYNRHRWRIQIIGPSDELLVAIPAVFAALIKGIPFTQLQSTLEAVMGKPACDGLYSYVLMDITHEEISDLFRDKNLRCHSSIESIVEKDPFVVKVFSSWKPAENKMVSNGTGQAGVIFKHFEGEEMVRVSI